MRTNDEGTKALYVRIPMSLYERIDEAAKQGQTWRRKGAVQAFVISALAAACPEPTKKAKRK